MFQGWLSFAGTELANSARMMAYRDAVMPTLDLRDCGDCATFADAMGDEPYTTPVGDDAEWVDVDRPESLGFIGFLPTNMSGFTDSTRTAGVTESLLDGGTVGRVRRGTREMRVGGWLIGNSQAAAEAGLSWMKAALDGSSCADCEPGDDLCFLLACPETEEEANSYIRHIRRVTCTSGPSRISEHALSSCDGYMIQIEFGFTAGSPYVYSEPVVVAVAEGGVVTPIVDGAEVFELDTPLKPCLAPKPVNGSGSILRDPDCPPVPNAPTVPILSSACKPLVFNASGYTYGESTNSKVVVDATPAYEARPHIATNGTQVVIVYSSSPQANQNVASEVHGRRGASISSLGSEYTAYNEGSGLRGVEPCALRWVPSKNKYIMGVVDFMPSAVLSPTKYLGRFFSSSDGQTWTQHVTLTSAVQASGLTYWVMTHVAHHDNGTTDGVLYAVGYGRRKSYETTSVNIFRSTNFGGSWTYIGVPHPVRVGSSYYNPRIAIWPDGEIIIAAQGQSTFSGLYYFKSRNGGKDWTWPALVTGQVKGWPMPVVARDDMLFVFYRDVTVPGSRGLGHARYRYSYDRGLTWSGAQKMSWYGEGGEQGQDATVLANGELAVAMGLDATEYNANVYAGIITRKKQYYTYAMYVPNSVLKTWQEGVLNLQIKTGAKPIRQMRVTLLPRPLENQQPEDLDPCSTCGSFIIDYAPANTIIYIDGMTERVTMAVGTGAPLPADHLVSGTNGDIFTWPIMTCGTGYMVVVDVDVATITSLALGVANRE